VPVKCEEYNNVCVLAPPGDLVGAESQQLRKVVEDLVEQRQLIDFVIDCEKVGFIDSEGLEALLLMKRKTEDLFGRLKLANLDENCRKILEITRLEARFECCPDLPTALKNMR
jgi:anti-anti-sigma factor